ncbi:putative membrane protein [Chryseobacterium defluvii]|uniref:Putative membrane protein n=2 Tax=Chryseobacterium defluvii TaxID=160396 RepID=A0A840KGD9_9FLAO|nr:putative membrane protein [Chryseobacterium defluvii]
MINKLIKHQRFEMTLLLLLMTLFCFSLSVVRYYVSETKVFFFLNWNLFLAWIPLIITSLAMVFNIKSRILLMLMITVWILFFPNSPYILTDLFHLRIRSRIPVWYDLIVILSYAWTGLICGFISLNDIERMLSAYFKKPVISVIVVFFLFLSSFGVYLGRFLRWNSWDILNNPFGLFNDIVVRFIYPLEYTKTWGVTLLMGIMLNFMYFMVKLFRKENRIVTRTDMI